MDVLSALKYRRTATEWDIETIPSKALISKIIEAATWAPNHRRTEPWRFHVIAGKAREKLLHAIQDDYCVKGYPQEEITKQIATIERKFYRSPLMIIVTQFSNHDDDSDRILEDYAACACAIQNLLLAAHAEELNTKWSTGKLVYEKGVFNFLGLENTERIVGFIYMGYGKKDQNTEPQRHQPIVNWYDFTQ